ncbi:MAG: nitrate/nitrite transporter NrtS [Gemmatimonadaceae bacterium]
MTRAFIMAAIVGPILIAINHSDALLRGDVSLARLSRMLLTVLVPYTVSTVSSVAAIRERRNRSPAESQKDQEALDGRSAYRGPAP